MSRVQRARSRRRVAAALTALALTATGAVVGTGIARADAAGTVLGTLQAPDGSPAVGATVEVIPVDGTGSSTTSTGQDGTWTESVAAGDYRVRFTQGPASSYAYGARSAEEAAVIAVAEDGITQVDDTLLAAPGSIAGTVTDSTGAPLAGICVRALLEEFRNDRPDPAGCVDSHGALTDAQGRYLLPGLAPAGYVVDAADPAGRYVRSTSPVVSVGAAQAVTGIALSLAPAGILTGLAVDGRSGKPLEGICPQAYPGRDDTSPLAGQTTCSDASGHWHVGGLAPGKYSVLLLGDAAHARRFVGGGGKVATATLLTARGGRVTAAGTVPLFAGATVTGRVTDRAGRPVADAWVDLGIFGTRAGPGEGQFTAHTDAEGSYVITNVPQMREIAEVYVVDQPYAWQWSGGAGDPVRATPLDLRYGRTTRYDVVLAPEATLTVHLKGVDAGSPVELGTFTASGLAEIGYQPSAETDGTYVLHNLPTGKVKVYAARFSTDPPTISWYEQATSSAKATPVAVAAGRQTEITFTVPAR